jgi:hypothetical protein
MMNILYAVNFYSQCNVRVFTLYINNVCIATNHEFQNCILQLNYYLYILSIKKMFKNESIIRLFELN